MRKGVQNAVLFCVSVLVAIGLAELALRLFVPLRDVGPSFTVHDPVLGKRVKESFSTERITPEFRMRFTTNSLGFRGPEPRAGAAAPILFLGDSFTMGYGVNDGEEFPALVAQALLRRDAGAPPVVNAGIGDSGNGYWIKFLRTRGEALAPRLVVMQVFENDFSDNLGEGLFALDADGQLVERAVPAPGLMRKAQRVIDAVPLLPASHLVGLMRQVGLPSRAGAPPRPTRDELTLRVLEEAVRSAEARNLDMLAMVVGLSPARREQVTALFRRHGVPAVVLPSKDERPDLYYVVDGHWNAAGHAFAADALVHAITRTCASGCRAGR
jgi:hypothetical protein